MVVAVSMGATATFSPVGPTQVAPGTAVVFNVSVATETLPGFDAADIVIGSDHASDLGFTYSSAWQAAFGRVTPPTADVGLYVQDVFVGGNNTSSVGTTLPLGTVTVYTAGLSEGSYDVRIDADVARDVSSLILTGVHEDLGGLGTFTIACPFADPQCDNDVDLDDFQLLWSCIGGPQQSDPQCGRYDTDADADVDLVEVGEFLSQFTGAR